MNEDVQNPELKPPLTYEGQLEKMKGRHLVVNDEAYALKKLKQYNYYRLSAYTLHLKENDIFLPDISFEQIVRLYDFDTHLRNMLMPLLEQIEIAFRTHISYVLAIKHNDPLAYRDKNNFVIEPHHTKFLEELDREISRSKEIFALHHRKKYNGQFPIWVAVELMSFGTLSKLYGNMKSEDQKEIAKEHYGLSAEYVNSWLRALSYVRNICAHYGRLYNKNLTIKPTLFHKEKRKIDNQKIFASILITKRLSKNDGLWNTFLSGLIALIENYSDVIDLNLIGFSENWLDILNE